MSIVIILLYFLNFILFLDSEIYPNLNNIIVKEFQK